ncbi:MAG: hypothetical protein ACRDSK_07355 [Actinophytocola sp.]
MGWTHDQHVHRERPLGCLRLLGSHASLALVSTLAMTFQEPELGQV